MYSSTLSLASALNGGGGQRHATARIIQGNNPSTHFTGGSLSLGAGLDGYGISCPNRSSSPNPSTHMELLNRLRYPGSYCCRLLTQCYTPDFTHELHFDNSTFHTDILGTSYIQVSSRRKVNILRCDRIGHGEKKAHTSSEWLQIQSCLNLTYESIVRGNKERDISYC
jgi:hypothetical protein